MAMDMRRMTGSSIQVSFDSFPYHLCEVTRQELCSYGYIHLVSKKKFFTTLVSSSFPFLLMSGPAGTEIYQETLAKALAKEYDATLLIYDPLPADASLFGLEEQILPTFTQLAEDAREECRLGTGRVVIFLSDTYVRDIEQCISLKSEFMRQIIEERFDMPEGVLVIGSHIRHKEELESPFDLLIRKDQASLRRVVTKPLISRIFPGNVTIRMPRDDEAQALKWKLQLDLDGETLRARRNVQRIGTVLESACWKCNDLENISIRDEVLTNEMVDRIVGFAISHHLMKNKGVSDEEDAHDQYQPEALSSGSLEHGFNLLEAIRGVSKIRGVGKSLKKSLEDVVTENDYEKKLLADVIPYEELGVSFDDVGALDNVKDALRESVMLPLQRPELFSHGQLTKPCKGILLFGPPGTGKTMLAKAVATEAGANFISVSASSITSKWYGEAEKYAKAVFTLASKIAPAVVFIDEVDSMLSCRGSSGESEASRRLKNEFMMNWDGLRTKDKERVLVLAATNRPFDLDEAVVRRFPRRLMVGLPDSSNRHKILGVILSKEELAPDVDLVAIANMSDGYSGSDLKHLCVVAAHCRIREILEKEKKNSALVSDDTRRRGSNIRPLKMDDFKYAHHEQVGASTSSQSANTSQLLDWNNQYGEGVSRNKQVPTYFL